MGDWPDLDDFQPVKEERTQHERLVNLLVSLEQASMPRTFAQLRRDTQAYVQADEDAARRMFERDKQILRDLGVQLRTVEGADGTAYELDDTATVPPRQADLTPEEATALAIAIGVSGGQRERLALSRLTAGEPDPSGDAHAGAPLRLPTVDAGLRRVATAVTAGDTLQFDYRRADGSVATRTVDAWGLCLHNGASYLVGHDHDRAARRTFRLSRVVSDLSSVDAGFTPPPDDFDLGAVFATPFGDEVDVHLLVRTTAVGDLVRRGGHLDENHRPVAGPRGEQWHHAVVPNTDPVRLRAWLFTDADKVAVLAPTGLVDEIDDALLAAVGRPANGGPPAAAERGGDR